MIKGVQDIIENGAKNDKDFKRPLKMYDKNIYPTLGNILSCFLNIKGLKEIKRMKGRMKPVKEAHKKRACFLNQLEHAMLSVLQ